MPVLTRKDDLDLLLERCRKHDSAAWGTLVERFQALVFSIARRYGLGADDAADVLQITFSRLIKNLDRIEAGAVLPRWLGVTAANESLRMLRTRGRYTDLEQAGQTLDELVAHEEADAHEKAAEADQARIIRDTVDGMPAKCRDLLTLLYLEEIPYEEVADRLGLALGSIGPTRARCLQKLKQGLDRVRFFE